MGWAALAQAAMDWTGGYLQARQAKAANDAQKIIDEGNTYASNLINNTNAAAKNLNRSANNSLAAAQAAFGNLTKSLSNSAKLTSAGNALDANSQNMVRLQDGTSRGSFEQGLRAAEQMGALQAQVAAAGTGGATASMLHRTLELSAARQRTTAEINSGYQTYDMLQQRMGLVSSMVQGLDQGQTFAPVDYSVDIAPLTQSPFRAGDFAGSAASQAWMGMLTKNAGNFASQSFGGGSTGGTVYGGSTTLDMNDGWNNFSTHNFSSTPNLGTGNFDFGGTSGSSMWDTGMSSMFSSGTSSSAGASFSFS